MMKRNTQQRHVTLLLVILMLLNPVASFAGQVYASLSNEQISSSILSSLGSSIPSALQRDMQANTHAPCHESSGDQVINSKRLSTSTNDGDCCESSCLCGQSGGCHLPIGLLGLTNHAVLSSSSRYFMLDFYYTNPLSTAITFPPII